MNRELTARDLYNQINHGQRPFVVAVIDSQVINGYLDSIRYIGRRYQVTINGAIYQVPDPAARVFRILPNPTY